MNSKVTYIIGGIFTAYLLFVAVVIFVYEPQPEDRAWDDRQAFNLQKMSEVSFGQSLDEIRTLLGSADFVEAKTGIDGQYQVMYYRTHHIKSDGETTKEECTPLLFRDNLLIAWGQDTEDQYFAVPVTNLPPQ
ncbi:DUF3192 domain-containing protein [Shewanella sp. SG41-4]|uniref:DUF3192 domain-containing protein n=1 Tax=Shewanella sp. SG41-4 TaxID=2760976 RepID=UPI0016029D73|nr:DUF3192 domain-containing protein [Shewanella sp. SG41-4]MBB1438712.1 DUF3192 domain-containing protein [Shewanella sp. SG41-4]